jgi:pimeloyl-ACP methyl ester carboxylesterase
MTLPVVIIPGDGDKVVFQRRSKQLRDGIPGSRLEIVKGAGHMVHHVATRQVAQAGERDPIGSLLSQRTCGLAEILLND